MKFRKKKCDYHKCKGLATKQIETKLNMEPYVLNVCEKCYEEYLECVKELNTEKPREQIIREGMEVLNKLKK